MRAAWIVTYRFWMRNAISSRENLPRPRSVETRCCPLWISIAHWAAVGVNPESESRRPRIEEDRPSRSKKVGRHKPPVRRQRKKQWWVRPGLRYHFSFLKEIRW